MTFSGWLKEQPLSEIQEPGSDELYLGWSLEDLNESAHLTVWNVLSQTEDSQVLHELAEFYYGNARSHEKNGDMEKSYFYAMVSHLLQKRAIEKTGTPEENLERPEGEGWEGAVGKSRFYEPRGSKLHIRYTKRRQMAVVALMLGIETELVKVLASSSQRQSSLSGRPTLPPMLPLAAPGNRADQEGAATFTNSTAGHENTSSDVNREAVKSDSKHPHQQNPEDQTSLSSSPLGLENSPRKHQTERQCQSPLYLELYLGKSLDDLNESARTYISSLPADEEMDEVQLKKYARNEYIAALGREGCGDMEMAYVFYERSRLFVKAAAELHPSGSSIVMSERVFGGTTYRDLLSTHTRLKDALQQRYDRRRKCAVVASKAWPGIRTEFGLALGISSIHPIKAVQVSDSTVDISQTVQTDEDRGTTSKHEKITTINTTSPNETLQQDYLTSIRMPSGAKESKRQQESVNFCADREASINNLATINEKNKGNGEVAAIVKGPVASLRPIAEVPDMGLLASTGQLPPNMRNHDRSGSSSTDICVEHITTAGSTNGTEKKPKQGLIGIRNKGYLCYMISVVQCLSNIPQVTHMLKKIQGLTLDKENEPGVARELGILLSNLKEGKVADINNFEKVIGISWKINEINRQQDAQELLCFLLNQLRRDLGMRSNSREGHALRDTSHDASVGPHEEASTGTDESGESREEDWTIVDELFRGKTTNTVTCDKCHRKTQKYESFLYLPLEIPCENLNGSLKECLDRYLRLEDLEDVECDQCHNTGGMKKKVDICRLPPVLIIWFIRYQGQSDNRLEVNRPKTYQKLNTFVDFPLDSFRVDPQDVSQNSYSLVAVTNHRGDLSGGHYTAFCKNAAQQTWYKCDDKDVTQMLDSEIVTSEAYLLFYSATSDQHGVE